MVQITNLPKLTHIKISKFRNRTSSGVHVRVCLLIFACSITIFTFLLLEQGLGFSSAGASDDGIAFLHDNPATATVSTINRNNFSDRQFLNFDEAGPTPLFSRTNLLKDAVPERRRIPPEFMEDIQFHLQKKLDSKTRSILGRKRRGNPQYGKGENEGVYNWQHDFEQDNRALYLQNPSILPLHNTVQDGDYYWRDDPDNLSEGDLRMLTGGDPAVRYVGFFSANVGGKCFGAEHPELYTNGEAVAYYAVALLDENLKDIDSVLIDLNAGPMSGNYKYWRQFIGDCRLVLIKGWIYGFCTQYVLRFKIRRKTQSAEDGISEYTGRNLSYPYKYPNIYGDGLDVILYSNQRIRHGKNFNVFRSSSRTDYYLQIWPSPHEYAQLKTSESMFGRMKLLSEQGSSLAIPRSSFDGPDSLKTIITCPENEKPSNKGWITNCTDAETSPFFGDKDHGTSCCIRLDLEGKEVNVGISHQKTTLFNNPWWRRDIRSKYNDKIPGQHYLSRFIAYHTQPPFDIVARSGWFCLGFDDGGANTQYTLNLFGKYACPAIHFPSTFAEVVGNPDRAIIGYGINDCTHNLIVVEKEEIKTRLLRGK